MRATSACSLLLLLASVSCSPAPPRSRAQDGKGASAPSAGARRAFPNPVVVTQEGKRVRFYDDLVKGRTLLVNFSYTNCEGRCPAATARLVEVQRQLGDRFGRDVFMLTISLDAENDTPEAVRRYVDAHHGRPGWTYVTGDREDLEALRRFFGFTDPDPRIDADRTQHAVLVAIGNEATGRWSAVPSAISADEIVKLTYRTMGLGTDGVAPGLRADSSADDRARCAAPPVKTAQAASAIR